MRQPAAFFPIRALGRADVAQDLLRGDRAMRVRGYTVLAHVATGDLATAALQNDLIDDLAVLKTSIADDGRLSGEIKNFTEDAPTLSISSNVLTVDMAVQNVVPFSFNANITTTTINNKPANHKYGSILWLAIADGSARTWAWLTSTVVWDGGVAPSFVTTNGHVMAFLTYTTDGGTTWRGAVVGSNYGS